MYSQFYNFKNLSRQTNTNCGWKATISTHSNELFQKKEVSCLKWTICNGRQRYKYISRQIQTTSMLSCIVTEAICTSKIMEMRFLERKHFSKSDMSKNFQPKKKRFLFVFYQNHNLNLWFFFRFKIWCSNRVFRFQENYYMCHQHQRTICWKRTTTWTKKLFHECVACVCLTFCTSFRFIAFFMSIGFFMGVMTSSFALPNYSYNYVWNSQNGWLTNF